MEHFCNVLLARDLRLLGVEGVHSLAVGSKFHLDLIELRSSCLLLSRQEIIRLLPLQARGQHWRLHQISPDDQRFELKGRVLRSNHSLHILEVVPACARASKYGQQLLNS